MIHSIELQYFKSFKNRAKLSFAPLTLLVGTNASGKSNAIEAIRLLSWAASGRPLDDLCREVQNSDNAVRGRIKDIPHYTGNTFYLSCRAEVETGNVCFHATLANWKNSLRVAQETLLLDGENVPIYSAPAVDERLGENLDKPDPYIEVAYNNFSRGKNKPRITCSNQQLILTQLRTPARFGETHKKAQAVIPKLTTRLCDLLVGIRFLDPSPRRMRGYSFKGDTNLKEDGSNISSVLHDICQKKSKKAKLVSFIESLPEQDIKDIKFIETSRNDVMVSLHESFGGKTKSFDAPLLSDGTLRTLAVAALLLTAEAGSLLIIEEIDNGVHPSRAYQLLQNIRKIALERSLTVLLTTHNPALLDSLPPQSIPDVVCCYRDPKEGDSRLIRLADLPHYPELVAQGPIGSLMTKGILEKFIKSGRTEEEKKKGALDWLAGLRAEATGA